MGVCCTNTALRILDARSQIQTAVGIPSDMVARSVPDESKYVTLVPIEIFESLLVDEVLGKGGDIG